MSAPALANILRGGTFTAAAVCGVAVCGAGAWRRSAARAARQVPAASASRAMSSEPEPEPDVDVGAMVAKNIAVVNERIEAKCASIGRDKVCCTLSRAPSLAHLHRV
jgi:hypothetical protein